jgi:hypothetical protein
MAEIKTALTQPVTARLRKARSIAAPIAMMQES